MKNLLAVATIASAMAIAGPVFAQADLNLGVGGNAQVTTPALDAGANAGSEINVDTVLPDRPFGDLAISTGAGADVRAQVGKLSDEQKTELRARCDVIATNPDRYSADVQAACSAM